MNRQDTKNSPVIEKIKKLLRMQRGGTQAEIETALAKAAALAEKHGVDLASVNPEEDEHSRLTHDYATQARRTTPQQRYAAFIVRDFFEVGVMIDGGRVVLIGAAPQVEIARYIFTFLVRHFSSSWTHRANKRLRSRAAFFDGLHMGLHCKLAAAREKPIPQGGLVPSHRAYIDRYFGATNDKKYSVRRKSEQAWSHGYAVGQRTEVRKGVTAPERKSIAA